MKYAVISGRYAQALYMEAKASGKLNEVAEELLSLLSAMKESKELDLFFNSPAISKEEKINVINAMAAKSSISKFMQAFLTVLAKNSRLYIFSDVVESVKQLIMEDNGEIEVNVDYATAVDDGIRAELVAQLTRVTGKKVILNENVDSSLLGGMKVMVGSVLYDASVKGRLDTLKQKISR